VREEDQEVSRLDGLEVQVFHGLSIPAMSHRRHAPGQGVQDRGGPPDCEVLQGCPSRQHQHHQRAGQVFPQQERGQDGQAGQEIRAEFPAQGLADQFQDQRQPAKPENCVERRFEPGATCLVEPEAHQQVEGDPRQGEERDGQVSPALPVQGRHVPGLRPGPF